MAGRLTRPLDRALGAAIERAGAPGDVRYTERQLYHQLCRVLLPRPAIRRPAFTLPAPVSYDRFRAALHRRGEVPGLVAPQPLRIGTEDELFDYGLPRLLVCQHPEIATMLLANDLHMEAACPVVSLADLPLDPRWMAALRAGNATVYVLHDASAAGLATTGQVRFRLAVAARSPFGAEADAPGIRITPLGLRPAHAAALHLTASWSGEPVEVPLDGLHPWERRWLAAGRVAEVAAVEPARLVRTVHRLVRGQRRVRPGLPRLREVQTVGFMSWPSEG